MLIFDSRKWLSFFWFFFLSFYRDSSLWNPSDVFSPSWFVLSFVCPNHTQSNFLNSPMKNSRTNFDNSSLIHTHNLTLEMYKPYSQLTRYISFLFLFGNLVRCLNFHFPPWRSLLVFGSRNWKAGFIDFWRSIHFLIVLIILMFFVFFVIVCDFVSLRDFHCDIASFWVFQELAACLCSVLITPGSFSLGNLIWVLNRKLFKFISY